MTLDLFDLLVVAQYVFNKEVPWRLWALGALASISSSIRLRQLIGK